MSGRWQGALLRGLISLALIALVLWRFQDRLAVVWALLASAKLVWVVVGVLLFWVAMLINAFKWWTLLRAQGVQVPFLAMARFTFVGFFFNNILPANIGGDVMRGYGLAKYTEQNAGAAASVMLDRLIGLSAYMSVAAISALIVVFITGRTDLWPLAVVAVIALMGLMTIAAFLISRRISRAVSRLLHRGVLEKVAGIWDALAAAFELYRFQYRSLALAFFIGLMGIATTSMVNYVLSLALGGGIPLLDIFLFTPLIALVLIVPISIGGIGLSQVAYPFFYGLVGVPGELALALSLFVQAVQIFCSLPGGVLWLLS
ncbi:MAG TPA: flippase-like domain-containing protein [Anaerolineae bacterium]|nr:flippase-like domain-containing protein [Anaerolineae bacterium]